MIASCETPASVERVERALQQLVGDAAVEAGDDDADRAALAERRPLEDGEAVGHLDLAAHVLDADAFRRRVLDHRRRLGRGPALERIGLAAPPPRAGGVGIGLLLVDLAHSGGSCSGS